VDRRRAPRANESPHPSQCSAYECSDGLPRRRGKDLNLGPTHAVRNSCAKRLNTRLFRGEPAGVEGGRIWITLCCGLLGRREHPIEKSPPSPLYGPRNPVDLTEVRADPNDHGFVPTNENRTFNV
jgi:hypothetical protein